MSTQHRNAPSLPPQSRHRSPPGVRAVHATTRAIPTWSWCALSVAPMSAPQTALFCGRRRGPRVRRFRHTPETRATVGDDSVHEDCTGRRALRKCRCDYVPEHRHSLAGRSGCTAGLRAALDAIKGATYLKADIVLATDGLAPVPPTFLTEWSRVKVEKAFSCYGMLTGQPTARSA